MAYSNANLVLTGNQQDGGPYYFVYTTADLQGDVVNGGYFAGAFGRLRLGDIVRVAAADGDVMYRVVAAQTSGVMALNNLETL